VATSKIAVPRTSGCFDVVFIVVAVLEEAVA